MKARAAGEKQREEPFQCGLRSSFRPKLLPPEYKTKPTDDTTHLVSRVVCVHQARLISVKALGKTPTRRCSIVSFASWSSRIKRWPTATERDIGWCVGWGQGGRPNFKNHLCNHTNKPEEFRSQPDPGHHGCHHPQVTLAFPPHDVILHCV